MNKFYSLLFIAGLSSVFVRYNSNDTSDPVLETEIEVIPEKTIPADPSEFNRHGKSKNPTVFQNTYTKSSLEKFDLPAIDDEVIEALERQLKVLHYKKRSKKQLDTQLDTDIARLEQTIHILLRNQYNTPEDLAKSLDAFQLKGKDGKGNVHFTGYFTPIIKVKKEKDEIYKYPIYGKPKNWEGRYPTRREIDGEGAFDGLGLELAYAANIVDIYFMQVQGSSYVQYPDGTKVLFAHAGSNGHSYRSIGRYMIQEGYAGVENVSLKSIDKFFQRNPDLIDDIMYVNKSYVFFTPVTTKVKGAGHVPLTTNHSIAVDPEFIPLGSVVLATVPVLDKKNFVRHELRYLVAQDIGGAINGPGHVDLYCGIGNKAKSHASNLHHYGNIWVLQPKENQANRLISEAR